MMEKAKKHVKKLLRREISDYRRQQSAGENTNLWMVRGSGNEYEACGL